VGWIHRVLRQDRANDSTRRGKKPKFALMRLPHLKPEAASIVMSMSSRGVQDGADDRYRFHSAFYLISCASRITEPGLHMERETRWRSRQHLFFLGRFCRVLHFGFANATA
jgi:hypothetical protein